MLKKGRSYRDKGILYKDHNVIFSIDWGDDSSFEHRKKVTAILSLIHDKGKLLDYSFCFTIKSPFYYFTRISGYHGVELSNDNHTIVSDIGKN